MQDRNSAWASLNFKQAAEELTDPTNPFSNVQNYNVTMHNPDQISPRVSLDYVQRSLDLNLSANEKRLAGAYQPPSSPISPFSNSRIKTDNHHPGNQHFSEMMSFNDQVTRSEPTTRTNSINYDQDQILCSKLTEMNMMAKQGIPRWLNLTIPSRKFWKTIYNAK